MKAEYREYPPRIAHDVQLIEQRDGGRTAFIAGSTSAGRFILLGETERCVLRMLAGILTPAEVCSEFNRHNSKTLTTPTLQKFLTRLDNAGILAGQRANDRSIPGLKGARFYARWRLFNPDRLFERMVSFLPWVWTKGFVIATLLLISLAFLVSVIRLPELSSHTLLIIRQHYVAVFIAGVLIGFTHEFAHGLTCKAFGGRVPEIGVLMIYYLLPALYCNVSGAYLIPSRGRRLWVIFAGIYWQVLVGALALLVWHFVQPHTLISDVAIIFFLGSVVDLLFNANPLIKLDGYYFLSQLLRLPNLMERSAAYLRGVMKRVLFGESDVAARRWDRRERAIYVAFGLSSKAYTVSLRILIVFYVGSYLADKFNVAGLTAAAALGIFYLRQPLGQMSSVLRHATGIILETLCKAMRGVMGKAAEKNVDQIGDQGEGRQPRTWKRRIVWTAVALVGVAVLCTPWSASVGSYGTLVAMPDREVVVRAPEDATLVELRARPGDVVDSGNLLGRMGNFELEEQIVQAKSDRASALVEYERLLGALRVRAEQGAHAELQLSRRQQEFDQFNSEQQQIDRRLAAREIREIRQVNFSSPSFPAAIATLQAEADTVEVRLQEATAEADRSRELFNHGVVSRSELESKWARAASLRLELVTARKRLEAALIEHKRGHAGSYIDLGQASSELRAEHLQAALLSSQLRAARESMGVLDSRLRLLERKRAQFELITSQAGTVYGEDLPRMVRSYFQKGEEICRVADTQVVLLKIQLPEREIGDVRVAHQVRLKVRAYPDRMFYGEVSKIGAESERDEHNQTTYRVEASIENAEGLLRPGMTAFARIDFGRQMIGRILAHKLKQLLRPEAWML